MAIRQQSYQITGMRQDNLVGTNSSNKFAHENMNLRLNTIGDYTTAAWTTEQGTLPKPVDWSLAPSDALELLVGSSTVTNMIVPIGQAVLNDQWIVFATQTLNTETDPEYKGRIGHDFIFKYWYQPNSDQLMGTILYAGNLNFDAKHPCETIPFYENEDIQKVYWTDGRNQPRVINIADTKYHTKLDGQFDFVQEVSLRERVNITKKTDGAGLFPPCTVKYAITYYKKHGQETNIVYDSPLYYPIKGERACSPDELSGDSFEIKVTNLDTTHGFDYIRLYSIIRTSDNATPIVRVVEDKELSSLPVITNTLDPDYNPNTDNRYALFIDTNTSGWLVDPTILQYIGGKEVIAQTFDQKSNTLFLGNIELVQKSAAEVLQHSSLGNDISFVLGDYHTTARAYDSNGYEYAYNNKKNFAYDNEKAIGIRVNAENQDYSFYQYSNQMTETNHWHSYADADGQQTWRKHNGNSRKIKIFKYGETYRFGIQFQDIKGNWSDVIFLADKQNNIKPITDEWSSVGVFGVLRYVLPNDVVATLLANNYIRARLVCCYPNNTDRTILAQGVLNPTIENQDWKTTHAPDAIASWFFRPHDDGSTVDTIPYKGILKNNAFGNCEIQSIYSDSNKDNYTINRYVLTMNSPEITFDESIRTLALESVNIDSIGYVPIQSWAAYVHVEATTPFPSYQGSIGTGLKAAGDVKYFDYSFPRTGSHFVNQGEWIDRDYWRSDRNSGDDMYSWILYPFHRKGSLADYIKDVSPWEVGYVDAGGLTHTVSYPIRSGSILETKCLGHLIYSGASVYRLNTDTPIKAKNFTIVDSNVNIPTKVGDLIYYGNVDLIAPVTDDLRKQDFVDNATGTNNETTTAGSYALKMWQTRTSGVVKREYFGWTSDPVPITYNSTAHGVFISENYDAIEPTLNGSSLKPYLPIVDLKKNVTVRFGGEPGNHNIFIPCGPVVDLRECEIPSRNIHTSPVLLGLEGDHYYMRYDCLKTYPRSIEDINQIVEILSFMCETRVNLDGRYDKNRGLSDNTTIGNENFNLINMSYTQSNNLFKFNIAEDNALLNKFSNTITWTKTKTNGEDVDVWTNITMVSTADAEGTCGKINKIININDTLYDFQDHGIAQIGYNEKTALSTQQGVPLEIANSGKFSGLKYLSREIGCQNKWSISTSKNGVFFIDDTRQELLTISEALQSLSTAHGFDAFFIQELPDSEHFTPWTPYEPNNFISFYDKLGNDVLYINKNYCLAWNEQSKTFTSFYSYNNVPIMANVGTHLLMWDINTPLTFNIKTTMVKEDVVTYEPVEYTWTEVIEHTTTTESDDNPIFDDDNKLCLVFYHYKDGSQKNEGLTPYAGGDIALDPVRATNIYIKNTLDNIKDSWIRHVCASQSFRDGAVFGEYRWDAHYILSLEFRKNGEPFILQFEIEGTHIGPNIGALKWITDPDLPKIRVRTTSNVTDEEFDRIKLFLGGYNQPTFNTGNVAYNGSFYGRSPQPWDSVDDGFDYMIDGTERELLCVAKFYDLTKNLNADNEYRSDNPLVYWHYQGNPFRTSSINDNRATVDDTMYNRDDLRYNTTTTKETIEHTEIKWEERHTTKFVPVYTVTSASTNIWAARELIEDNQAVCGKFFGYYRPYWMTIVCDGITDKGYAFSADKVFNNIEYRADVFDRITGLPRADINIPVFDLKAAYNGYQAYKEFPIDAVRKFNIWRVQLPRATYYDKSTGQFKTTRDRIRNPYCYIKLMQTNGTSQEHPGNPLPNRMILHDLVVYFDAK